MTVKILKSNIEVTSTPKAGIKIAKANIEVTSRPPLFVVITKMNLMVTSRLRSGRRRASLM